MNMDVTTGSSCRPLVGNVRRELGCFHNLSAHSQIGGSKELAESVQFGSDEVSLMAVN